MYRIMSMKEILPETHEKIGSKKYGIFELIS